MKTRHPTRPHLRAWRQHLGKTLEWVAEQIGTSHTTVMRYETAASGVDNETFQAIAAAYGITVAELSAPPEAAETARQLDRVMRAIREMDADTLAVIAGFAERLKP